MDTENTLYQGIPERTAQGGLLVLKNGQPLSPKPSQKIRNYSPNGFNWGYGGSGPAQLALALLLDVTGDRTLAFNYHQQFKWEKIATLELNRPWKMTKLQIESWLRKTVEITKD